MKTHTHQFDIERALRTLILCVIALWIVLSSTGCSVTRRETLGIDNRFDQSVAGKFIPGHYRYFKCEPYAIELSKALDAKGIPNRKLAYEWVNHHTGSEGLHAVVLFEKDGGYWLMDNQRDKPKQVFGNTDLEVCKQFGSHVRRMQDWSTWEWAKPTEISTLLHPKALK